MTHMHDRKKAAPRTSKGFPADVRRFPRLGCRGGIILAVLAIALVSATSSREARANEPGGDPRAASRLDQDRTSILVVFGALFDSTGVTPYPDGTSIRIRNPRTARELTAVSGDTDPGRYEAVYLDYETNDAAAIGDSVVFALDVSGRLNPRGVVLSAADIAARQVRVDLTVLPPIRVGACCYPDGSCQIVPSTDCAAEDGYTYLGHNAICEPDVCLFVGGGEVSATASPSVQGTPNPFRDRVALRISGPVGSVARVSIFDASGRQIRCLWQGGLSDRGTQVWWDGRDGTGRVVPAGFYMARVFGVTVMLSRGW